MNPFRVALVGNVVLGLGYVLCLALCVGLLLTLALVLYGPFAASGEHWEGAALMCYVAWPVLAAGSAASIVVYPIYARSRTRRRALLVFCVNILGVLLAGLAFVFGLATFFRTAWIAYARWVAP